MRYATSNLGLDHNLNWRRLTLCRASQSTGDADVQAKATLLGDTMICTIFSVKKTPAAIERYQLLTIRIARFGKNIVWMTGPHINPKWLQCRSCFATVFDVYSSTYVYWVALLLFSRSVFGCGWISSPGPVPASAWYNRASQVRSLRNKLVLY